MPRDYSDPVYRAKLSEANYRRWADPEYRARVGESVRRAHAEGRIPSQKGVPKPPSVAEAARRPKSPEHRAAISRAKLGQPKSPEHRQALRESVLNLPVLGECVYCGGPATGHDHIIPVSVPYGGSDHPDNVMLACSPCNSSKHARDPWAWLAAGLVGRRRDAERAGRSVV